MKCIYPKWLRKPNESTGLLVPCGKCIACRASKAKEWSIRILHESNSWVGKCSFITLTYDDDNLPFNYGDNGEVYQTLVKSDFQKFMKRLRKYIEPQKVRYFACGEYGEETLRPHYHLILFGLSPLECELVVKDTWTTGMSKIGTVSIESIRYVAGYVEKKLYDVDDKEKYETFYKFREKPFTLMSQGIGKEFCFENEKQISQQKLITVNGIPSPIPRYYCKKLDLQLSEFQTYEEYQDKLVRERLEILTSAQRELNLRAKNSLKTEMKKLHNAHKF